MRFSTIIILGSTLATSAFAASIPGYQRRSNFDDEITTLTRRAGVLVCNSHNDQVMCGTTHECLTSSGAPTHIPGTYAGNGHCATACHCGRQPLAEISGNEQRTKTNSRRPAARPAARPASRSRGRRSEFEDEITSLTRRAGVLVCNSHNDQVMCGTTHECLTSSGAPTHIPGTYAGNGHCATACHCGRQPLAEISGNEQRTKTNSRRPAARPAARPASRSRGRRSEFEDEITSLTRRAGVLVCDSHNDQVMCGTTHECLTSSGAPTHIPGTYAGNGHCATACHCGRQPLAEISGNEQRTKTNSRRPAARPAARPATRPAGRTGSRRG